MTIQSPEDRTPETSKEVSNIRNESDTNTNLRRIIIETKVKVRTCILKNSDTIRHITDTELNPQLSLTSICAVGNYA